MVLKPFETVSV